MPFDLDAPAGIAPLSFDTNQYIRRLKTADGDTRFLNLREILTPADEHGFGVIAANACTPEMVDAVMDAAWNTGSPAIIEVAESQMGYALLGRELTDRLEKYVDLVERGYADRARTRGYAVPICLHVDHLQKDSSIAYAAAKAGFTSMELDFSKQPTEDRVAASRMNAERCRPIIGALHPLGISFEVEEGEIGDAKARKAQKREDIEAEITRPEYAVPLVAATRPEALAVFVGSAHGEEEKPFIFYSRIGEIREALRREGIDVPLVLHGGTGQTNEGFQEAARQGARKFNYASRFWTIQDKRIMADPRGAAIMKEMAEYAAAKGKKSGRYVFNDFVVR
ncbi:MAG: class II fructose-bisphosphate aldolase, partial [Candidatus Aenigmarchaeota archaeon]|nr:class II fructose-bisphosphate aldolase [Candidatus Aenigmarchaeota archaeon]